MEKVCSIPFDCVGVILSFIDSPRIFLNILLLNRRLKQYLENLMNPDFCRNIKFHINGKPKEKCPLVLSLHVTQLYLGFREEDFEEYFPNLKELEVKLDRSSAVLGYRVFKYTPKLEKVKIETLLFGNVDFYEASESLRTIILKLDRYSFDGHERPFYFNTANVKNLVNLNHLRLNGCFAFPKEFIFSPSKLKRLELIGLAHLRQKKLDEIFQEVGESLEVLRFESIGMRSHYGNYNWGKREIDPNYFAVFRHLKKINRLELVDVDFDNKEKILKNMKGHEPKYFVLSKNASKPSGLLWE